MLNETSRPIIYHISTLYSFVTLTFLSISGRSSRQVVCMTCVGDSGSATGSKFTCCPAVPRRKPSATRPLVMSDAILKGKLFRSGPSSSSMMSSPGVVPPLVNWTSSSYFFEMLSVMIMCRRYYIKYKISYKQRKTSVVLFKVLKSCIIARILNNK